MNHSLVADLIIAESLDVRGLFCPMPLLKAKQAIKSLSSGQVLEVLATDSGSWRDFAAWAQQAHHVLLVAQDLGDYYRYCIQKES